MPDRECLMRRGIRDRIKSGFFKEIGICFSRSEEVSSVGSNGLSGWRVKEDPLKKPLDTRKDISIPT